jgi:hypothetical protein
MIRLSQIATLGRAAAVDPRSSANCWRFAKRGYIRRDEAVRHTLAHCPMKRRLQLFIRVLLRTTVRPRLVHRSVVIACASVRRRRGTVDIGNPDAIERHEGEPACVVFRHSFWRPMARSVFGLPVKLFAVFGTTALPRFLPKPLPRLAMRGWRPAAARVLPLPVRLAPLDSARVMPLRRFRAAACAGT